MGREVAFWNRDTPKSTTLKRAPMLDGQRERERERALNIRKKPYCFEWIYNSNLKSR